MELCNKLGYPIGGAEAASIHDSLIKYARQAEADDAVKNALPVLVQLLSKAMVVGLDVLVFYTFMLSFYFCCVLVLFYSSIGRVVAIEKVGGGLQFPI